MSSTRKITLRSSDGELYEVEETVAVESQILKHLIEKHGADCMIPLPNVTGKSLAKVIEYCRKHAESRGDLEELKEWDTEFIKVDHYTLFDLILAANYLNVEGLLGLTCQAVADMIKDKQPEEIRKLFNIKSSYTPEEEAEFRAQNRWAFE